MGAPRACGMEGLLVGRFQPFHLGHVEAVRFGLVRSSVLHLCIGSSDAEKSAANPFDVGERREMIESSLPEGAAGRVRVYAIPDFDDHAKWAKAIDAEVPGYDVVYTNDPDTAAFFRRRNKDTVEIPLENRGSLEGSGIRRLIASGGDYSGLVPPGTAAVLERVGARERLSSFNYK